MTDKRALIIGGGIGGLTAAVALRQRGVPVLVIERDPQWSVEGVGITQQSNVVRAVAELGIVADYVDAGFGYAAVEAYAPDGALVARVPSPQLAPPWPPNIGIARPALEGTWFKQGFQGTMGALLAAVESGTPPLNAARGSLDALAMVFAAIASARTGMPVVPGAVRTLAEAEG